MQADLAATLNAHEGIAWNVKWSPSGKMLASCGQDRSVRVWIKKSDEASKWICLYASLPDAFPRTVRSLSWSPDEKSIVAACFDATAVFLVPDTERMILHAEAVLEGHENEVKGVALSRSGNLLASCSRDKSIWLWEIEDDWDLECIAVLNGHKGDVKNVKWHPNAEILASCSYDDTVRIWKEEVKGRGDDWYCASQLTAHKSTVWDIAFDAAGQLLASVSADHSIIVWRTIPQPPGSMAESTWRIEWSDSKTHSRPIYCVDWSSQSDRLLTGGGDDKITVYQCHRRALQGEDFQNDTEYSFSVLCNIGNAHQGDVNSVAWHPKDDNIFASCGDDGLVKIWRLKTQQP